MGLKLTIFVIEIEIALTLTDLSFYVLLCENRTSEMINKIIMEIAEEQCMQQGQKPDQESARDNTPPFTDSEEIIKKMKGPPPVETVNTPCECSGTMS